MYAENNQRTSDEIFLLSHIKVYGNNKAMVEFMKLFDLWSIAMTFTTNKTCFVKLNFEIMYFKHTFILT